MVSLYNHQSTCEINSLSIQNCCLLAAFRKISRLSSVEHKMNRKISAASGIGVGLSICIFLIFTFTSLAPGLLRCRMIDNGSSNIDPYEQTRKASSDLSSLATLTGAIKVDRRSDNVEFLPIQLDSVSYDRSDEWKYCYKLQLLSNCSKLILQINTVDKSVMEINVQADLGEGWHSICTVHYPYMWFYNNTHYACDRTQRLECQVSEDYDFVGETPDYILELSYIEFEINGNPDEIGRGQFSSPPNWCI